MNLDDPAVTLELLRLDAVVGVTGFFDQKGKIITQWNNLGTPWGVFVKGDKLYVVDGTEANCLFIASTKDGRILERVDGLKNATAVTVDANDAIYIGEVNGTNVRKLVRKH